jgi:hypothetical protein
MGRITWPDPELPPINLYNAPPHHGANRMTEPKYPRRNLYLEADVMDSLRDIGDSNASRGVRVAVEYYERNHPKPWTLEPKSVDKWYRPEKKAKADVPFTFDGEK